MGEKRYELHDMCFMWSNNFQRINTNSHL